MANTFKLSDFQSDPSSVFENVTKEHPVYVSDTEDSDLKYVILTVEDFEEYEQTKTMYQIMQALNEDSGN